MTSYNAGSSGIFRSTPLLSRPAYLKVAIVGGGPAGLYTALLLKKADPHHDVTVLERNRADDTFGWGVVFSDRTMEGFRTADAPSHAAITGSFHHWDDIDVHYRGTLTRTGGHGFCGIERKRLLGILQERGAGLGVEHHFQQEITDDAPFADADLIVAADNAWFSDPVVRLGIGGVEYHGHTWEWGARKAKELLFTARVVEAEEAYRIGLLNHLVPRAQLRTKTMEIAKTIARNHRGAVMGVKALMLQQMALGLEEQFKAEEHYTRHVLRGAKAKEAFPEFIARKGLTTS